MTCFVKTEETDASSDAVEVASLAERAGKGGKERKVTGESVFVSLLSAGNESFSCGCAVDATYPISEADTTLIERGQLTRERLQSKHPNLRFHFPPIRSFTFPDLLRSLEEDKCRSSTDWSSKLARLRNLSSFPQSSLDQAKRNLVMCSR